MATATFNPLAAARDIEAAGVERAAAEAIATAIAHGDERAATKADLAGTEQALGARIDAVRSELGILRWVGGIESTVTLATFAIVAAKLLRASGPALPASAIW